MLMNRVEGLREYGREQDAEIQLLKQQLKLSEERSSMTGKHKKIKSHKIN